MKFAKKIRAIAPSLGEFTIHDLSEALRIQTYRDKAQLKISLKGIKRGGDIVTIRPGLFRFRQKEAPFSMVKSMWRTMLLKQRFTWQHIARISGASKSHVHKYLRFLEDRGFIKNLGDRSYNSGIWELIEPGKAPLEHPTLPKKWEIK